MQNKQLTEYVKTNLQAGYSEAGIRARLIESGWQPDVIETAFKACRPALQRELPKQKKSVLNHRLASRPKRSNKWLSPKRIISTALCFGVAATVTLLLIHHPSKEPVPLVSIHLTKQQQQTIDVNTLGGAVGQYVAINNRTLPSRVAPAPDGSSVVLCGATCDPTTWQVSALQQYRPDNVKLVAYGPAISVPDVSSMYLVSGAKCDGSKATDKAVTNLSMVILYATEGNPAMHQHCVTL